MDLFRPSAKRVSVCLLVFAASVAVLIWFIPALTKSTQKAPVHNDIGLHSQCVASAGPPDYGVREPVNYCSND